MKIVLNQLKLTNFKGIRSLLISFDQTTNVFGQNGTGKSTLMDAFLWLLFGKDSSDRKDFEIKTLDENNRPYHRLDHEVEGSITVDGEMIVIRRVFKEKWVKKRGSQDAEFNGHETAFFWNDVPLSQSEYQNKIAALLNENIFKLITNTTYFNSLKWQERRSVLLSIAGEISNTDVFDSLITVDNKSSFSPLINALNTKKSVDEFKREIAAKKKKIRDDLDLIPARIDEANRSLPEAQDYEAIQKSVDEAMVSLQNVEALLNSKSHALKQHQDGMIVKMREVQHFRSQLQEIEFLERNTAQDKKRLREQVILNQKRELQNKCDDLRRVTMDFNNASNQKFAMEQEAERLRKKWHSINEETIKFNEDEFCCPTCKRAYEADDIDAKKSELTKNFNQDKSNRLSSIAAQGQKQTSDIKIQEATIGNLNDRMMALKEEIEQLESGINTLETENTRLTASESEDVINAIRSNANHKSIKEKIEALETEINTPFESDGSNSDLLERKQVLSKEIDELKKQLATKEIRVKGLARIKELEDQERTMAQELSTLEGVEYSIEQFMKAKMDTLESRINGRFKMVRFKMFEEQINGGQVESCTTLINGVPYADANTASKIQAGLDIINTLSEHYGVTAPIFIDNRESVVNIPDSNSQIINLIVSAKHKKLTVGESVEELAVA